MIKVEATEPVTLHSGTVELTDAQYEHRRTQVQRTSGKNTFIVTGKVQFKTKETFGIDSIPKGLEGKLKATQTKGAK